MNTNNNNWINYADVKNKLDFLLVLDSCGITYSAKGEQFKIKCPFHEPDKNPSCNINTRKKIFNCFSCKTSGNILDFIVLTENGDPKDKDDFRKGALKAVEIMGGNAPMRPKLSSSDSKSDDMRQSANLNSSSQKSQNLDAVEVKVNKVLDFALTPDPTHAFLANRGLTQTQISEFGLGYQNKGMMKNRIVFPIHNENNELIAYSGRWVDEDVPKGEMRYKLPEGFYKSLVLYNLNRVVKNFPETKHIVIVEGFWSTIRLHSAGVPVVSCFGTSISDEQIALLKKIGIENITLIFDGDEAGRKGVENSLPFLTEAFFVKTIHLDDGLKPDSMDKAIVEDLLEN